MSDSDASKDVTMGSPQAIVDDASIQHSMDRIKESLKVKLLLRRPINQLIDQGILPTPKSSPHFYEQSKKLERARMENYLKHKIQRRPDRQALIQKHILEDTTVSPSLQDKQRQLKKARLADNLNDRLSHRPGPLELVKGNILKADDRLAQAIKEGQIQFKATSEGEAIKHPPPLFHLTEDETTSSEGTPSPSLAIVPSPSSDQSLTNFSESSVSPPVANCIATNNNSTSNDLTSNPIASLSLHSPTPSSIILATPVTTSLLPSTPIIQAQPLFVSNFALNSTTVKASNGSPGSTFVTFTPATATVSTTATAVAAPTPATLGTIKPAFTPGTITKSETSAGKGKKSKTKVQQKTRTIKFHEYKGPPNAQKNQPQTLANSESSYELLLKQQQLFLQWQLEWQQKYPRQFILPANQKLDQQQGTNLQTLSPAQTLLLATNSKPIATTVGPPQQQALAQPTQAIVSEGPTIVHFSANTCSNSSSIINSSIGSSNICATKQPLINGAQGNSSPAKIISKLQGMKVSDLKLELKKRSLPVSGSKPQLVERLTPFFANDEAMAANGSKDAAAASPTSTAATENKQSEPNNSSVQQIQDEETDRANSCTAATAVMTTTTAATEQHVVSTPCKVEKVEKALLCGRAGNKNSGSDKDSHIFDLSLELQEIANSMDFGALTQPDDRMLIGGEDNCFGAGTTDLSKMDCLESVGSSTTKNGLPNGIGSNGLLPPSSVGGQPMGTLGSNDFSLNELMDWMSELTSNTDNALNNNGDRVRRDVQDINDVIMESINNSKNLQPTQPFKTEEDPLSMTLSSTNGGLNSGHHHQQNAGGQFKVHDPVLPNNMVGRPTQSDTMIDLYFDENEYKGLQDLGNAFAWDKL